MFHCHARATHPTLLKMTVLPVKFILLLGDTIPTLSHKRLLPSQSVGVQDVTAMKGKLSFRGHLQLHSRSHSNGKLSRLESCFRCVIVHRSFYLFMESGLGLNQIGNEMILRIHFSRVVSFLVKTIQDTFINMLWDESTF